jgi:hypothetical protein
LDEGIITKKNDHYQLTDFGLKVFNLLGTIEVESQDLFNKEVKKLKKSAIHKKKTNITIEEMPEKQLTISLDHQTPLWCQGEYRIYTGTERIPSEMEDPHGKGYEIKSCIERTWLKSKEEYHYIMYGEGYNSKYDGTEENRSIVQRTEDGYFLDTWNKIWKEQRHDGLYTTKSLGWGIRGSTEPEEGREFYEKELSFPANIKAGQKGFKGPYTYPKEPKEITATEEWEIVGNYRITIDTKYYECILKRVLYSSFYNGKLFPTIPKFIKDVYYTDGLLTILRSRWDKPVSLKYLGFKNWENNPTLEYKGETYYLMEEDYLSQRYIPQVNLGRVKNL